MACTIRCGMFAQMIIGILLSLIFTVLVIIWPTLFFNVLKSMTVLTKTSFSYGMWKETPIPMYLELYLYNFTNSEEVLKDNSIKPHFEDIGPYVFKEHHIKAPVSYEYAAEELTYFLKIANCFNPHSKDWWRMYIYETLISHLRDLSLKVDMYQLLFCIQNTHDNEACFVLKTVNLTWNDNGTVTFLQRRMWHFDSELSKGELSDKITNINIIAVTAGYFVRHRSFLVRLAVNSALNLYGESLVVTKTAKELLFDGYSDRLLEVLNTLNISSISLPFDKFGWFYGRNMSDIYDGWWTIYTGSTDLKVLGDMDLWNFNKQPNYYDGQCGAVKGTTGELFPPLSDPENVTVFASDICSYMTLRRNGSAVVQGVTGTVFTGDDSPFDNGANYPEEACFCRSGDVCSPPGTRNVSSCKFGAPAFVSYPHFYLADPQYLSKIDGLKPNKSEDEFKMVLELKTGIPLSVRAQLQINILIQRIQDIKMFDVLPDNLYVPMLWFKQEVVITKDLAKQAKLAGSIEDIMSAVFYALIAIGVILILIGIFVLRRHSMRRSESKALLTK